jgi:hypothetical protein
MCKISIFERPQQNEHGHIVKQYKPVLRGHLYVGEKVVF